MFSKESSGQLEGKGYPIYTGASPLSKNALKSASGVNVSGAGWNMNPVKETCAFQSAGFGISAGDQQNDVGVRSLSRTSGPVEEERGGSERAVSLKSFMTEPSLNTKQS